MATLQSILDALGRIEIVVPATADPHKVFSQLAALYDNRKVELTEHGHIVVMPPAGIEGGYLSGEVFGQIRDWARKNGKGKAFDSSAGFYITGGENRSPDAARVSNERIATIPKRDRKSFAPFCPDFAVEVKAPSDSLPELRTKCARYLKCGALEAWLIDPETQTVEVYKPDTLPRILQGITTVQGYGALATFKLELEEIWAGL